MDWKDIQNEKEKYAAYLCSREWSEKREYVRERAKNKCERCLVGPMDAVHHLTYARKYEELIEDLQGICNECHNFTHGKSDIDPMDSILPPSLDPGPMHGTSILVCSVCKYPYVTIGAYEFLEVGNIGLCHQFQCLCECGHLFKLTFRCEKGMTEVFTRNFQQE